MSWQGWVIPGVSAGFKTKAAAERHIRETRMTGVKPKRVKRPEDQIEWSKSLRKNSARKNPTKAQKREKAKKASAKRRVAVALAKFLKQANPGKKYAGCKMQRNAGGSITIIPVKLPRGRK